MNDEDLECGIEILRQQAEDFIRQIFLEEIKENADVAFINWLMNRILKTWSTISVLENRRNYQTKEEMENDLAAKNKEYIYCFAKALPKPVVKIEKLKWKQMNTNNKN